MMISENQKSKFNPMKGFLETPKQATAQSLTYIVAAFGFVAALAWNEAINALIDKVIARNGDTTVSLFVYAVLVTLLAVFATSRLNKINALLSEQKEEEQNQK